MWPTVSSRASRRCGHEGEPLSGQNIRDVVTVNGVRVTVKDGTWGLVRASSNKPELVVVESPVSEARMREMFKAADGVLRENPEVGAYNQSDLILPLDAQRLPARHCSHGSLVAEACRRGAALVKAQSAELVRRKGDMGDSEDGCRIRSESGQRRNGP